MITIKKRVSLDFLGEEYKDDFLVFKSIGIREFETVQEAAREVEKDDKKSVRFIQDQLFSRFVEGQVDGKPIKEEDLLDLPPYVVIECFNQVTGQVSPKV